MLRRVILSSLLLTAAMPALADPGSVREQRIGEMRVNREQPAREFDGQRHRDERVGPAARDDVRSNQDRIERMERVQRPVDPVLSGDDRAEALGRRSTERRQRMERSWEDGRRRGDDGTIDGRGGDSVAGWRGPRTGVAPYGVINRPTVTQAWRNGWRRDQRYDWHDYRQRNASRFRLGVYRDPFGWGYRRIGLGWNLGEAYYASQYWLPDPWEYRLPPAPPGFRWVRYHDDALLVDLYSGRVLDVIYDLFW